MLDTAYACYYQVQTQMSVCGLDSAYLVAWTEKDINFQEIAFEEILWKTITTKSHHLFVNSILPELVGKFYTWLRNMKPPTQTPEVSHAGLNMNTEEEKWCYCHQTESGCMISCDNNHCPVEWFNYTCAGISNASKAKQFCPDCCKLPQFKPKRKSYNRKPNQCFSTWPNNEWFHFYKHNINDIRIFKNRGVIAPCAP